MKDYGCNYSENSWHDRGQHFYYSDILITCR